MILYRICKEKYAVALNASGAANRWNQRGEQVIYTSATRSLCALEMIVNVGKAKPEAVFKTMLIEVPDSKRFRSEITLPDLAENWRSMAAYHELQQMGSEWYRSDKSLLLQIPSAVIPEESNFAINAEHPDFKKHVKLLAVEDYFWDGRLV